MRTTTGSPLPVADGPRIFKKDQIRLSPNMTGSEFAAVVATIPMADQQAIRAMVREILQERACCL